jgi:thiol-disulfide isomerase/thioredoxin
MNKKILIVAVILLVCIAVTLSFGQYRSNAPVKSKAIPAPDFSLQELSGQLGKPVVLFFGTTWCPSCRAEIPSYSAIYEKYARRGLQVIYIDINEPAEKVARFAKSHSFPYRVLLDRDGSVANDYNIVGVPTLVLIDKEGNIITMSHRTSDLPLNKLFPAGK